MAICLDQKTSFESSELGRIDPPVLISRVVLDEGGINIYTLRTAPTREHSRSWLHPNEFSQEVPLHYATTLSVEGQNTITMNHEYYDSESSGIKDKDVVNAMTRHLDLVSYLREYGGSDTRQLMYDPTRE